MAWTLLLLLSAGFLLNVLCEDVFITTKKGQIKGTKVPVDTSTTNIAFNAFLGIPYGEKPDRFQLAKAKNAWTDTLSTQTDGPMCPQPGGASYDEDCLYLNVYSPPDAATSSPKLPVMVFIPGGYFIYCSASSKVYGPDFLLTGNAVILVTINYRVGAAGFLSLGSKVAPGNLGLHDTLLALQWVQDEISVFGGDPTKVTLFGQSAGSVMAQYHYLSPLSTGLFRNAIMQSGSALSPWGYITGTEAKRRAVQMAKGLNCDVSKNDTTLLQCLQKADIKDIVGNQSISLSDYANIAGTGIPFVPVLDTNSTADKPFFSDSLENLIKAAASRAKPILAGTTADEGIIMFSRPDYLKAETNLAAFLNEGARNNGKVASIKDLYFNQSLPTLNKIKSLVSIYTDYLFTNPAIKVIREFANFTYGYEFAFDGTWSFPVVTTESNQFSQYNMRGVPHGADLCYLFYSTLYKQPLDTCTANAANINMKNNMVKWWTNFAANGVPDDNWPNVTKGGYFIINSSPSTKDKDTFEKQHNYAFWENMQKTNFATTTSANILLTLLVSLSAVLKRVYL